MSQISYAEMLKLISGSAPMSTSAIEMARKAKIQVAFKHWSEKNIGTFIE